MDIVNLSISRPPSSLPFFSSSHSTFLHNNLSFNFRTHNSLALSSRCRPGIAIKKKGFTCNAFFGLGVPELVVIVGVAALVFGPKKLPEVGRSIGKTVKSFQQAAKEFETELKKDPDSATESAGEKTTAISEEKKEGTEVPSSKESV
ncbi:hypothetical protein HS088_TW12G00746 [Tripterygium wilfordii]|uniref:Sec-independent protein translocase protein TATA chloroplastic n=2 Tax=Tripterygium wilfordii TaxID=458696 RepID=A0A7J7CZR0_TRIWF|nr:hypothetical protein HS088_TW12G00746 [Tripterygium wilfordii]